MSMLSMSSKHNIRVLSFEGDLNKGFATFQIHTEIYRDVGWFSTKKELVSTHTQTLKLFSSQGWWWRPGKENQLGAQCDPYIRLDCGEMVYEGRLFDKCKEYVTRQRAERDYKDHLDLHKTGI